MRNFFIFILFCFCGCESTSYLPEGFSSFEGKLSWVKTFGGSNEDIAHAVIETEDGGFAVFGNTKSVDGDVTDKTIEESDLWLLKFNVEAELEWTKTYGGSGDDRGHSLIQMNDGGFMLLGYSQSEDGLGSNNEGQHDNWVLRVDAQGVFMWERSFGYCSSLAALLRNHSSHFSITTRGTLPPCSMLKPETISSASAGSIGHVQRVKPPLSFSPFVGIHPDSPRLFRYSAVKRVSPNGRSKSYFSPFDVGTR